MKRNFLTGLASTFFLIAILVFPVQSDAAGKTRLGLSSTLSPGSCLELAADLYKDQVEKQSNGGIEIIRYPSGELFDSKSEIEAVSAGAVAMGVLHVAYVGARSPELEFISSFGGIGCWQDYDHYYRFLDQPEIRQVAGDLFEKKLNAKLLAIMAYGNSVIGTNKKPVHGVADLKNLKLRTAGSAQATMYRAIGVVPVEMSSREIFMALQRGTIEGAVTGPSRFYFNKLYEVAPYITQDYTLPYLSYWLAINLNQWNALPEKEQKILKDNAREVELWAREQASKETEMIYEKFRSGIVKELYFLPDEERAKIRKIAHPVMHDLTIKRCGKEIGEKLWGLMEKVRFAK